MSCFQYFLCNFILIKLFFKLNAKEIPEEIDDGVDDSLLRIQRILQKLRTIFEDTPQIRILFKLPQSIWDS